MSQWEREVIAERTKTALSVKRDKGQRISRHAPYGFYFNKEGNLCEDADEQQVVSKIRELKSQGHSIRAIAEHLESNGYRNRAGNPFGVKEVWVIAKAA